MKNPLLEILLLQSIPCPLLNRKLLLNAFMLKSNAAFVTFCAFPQISGIKLPLKMSVLNRTHSEEVATFETVKHQQSFDNAWS